MFLNNYWDSLSYHTYGEPYKNRQLKALKHDIASIKSLLKDLEETKNEILTSKTQIRNTVAEEEQRYVENLIREVDSYINDHN